VDAEEELTIYLVRSIRNVYVGDIHVSVFALLAVYMVLVEGAVAARYRQLLGICPAQSQTLCSGGEDHRRAMIRMPEFVGREQMVPDNNKMNAAAHRLMV
jgi:hypothetical protein